MKRRRARHEPIYCHAESCGTATSDPCTVSLTVKLCQGCALKLAQDGRYDLRVFIVDLGSSNTDRAALRAQPPDLTETIERAAKGEYDG